MNLIYICVFHNQDYIKLLKLLVTSISVKANVNKDTTDILIVTCPSFQPTIENELAAFDLPINYYILDLHTLFEAGCARLNIFKYDNIHKYENILYLDTDILVNSDINVLFNLEILSDKLYALEQGNIGHEHWGGRFFNFSHVECNTPAFTSGILLFKNSQSINILFDTINEHILDYIYIKGNGIPICLDQPFIVYNAISQNKYDNQVLKKYLENNPKDINSEKVIYHFPGGPGAYSSKSNKMNTFWEKENKIPKVLFQTNKTNLDTYIIQMTRSKLGSEWKYEFYNDDDVVQFFINNPIKDLPDILEKYNSIKKGAHKSDLFRYYYLYINGGFFMDADAMIYANIETIVKEYNFVSVNSSSHPGCIFQGILGASPKNEFIKRALYKAYNTTPDILDQDYHYFCKQLYDILNENNFGYNIKLYEELRKENHYGIDDILDGDAVIFKHYWLDKIIPPNNNLVLLPYLYTDWNNYNKSEINKFDYTILSTYKIPNNLVRIGPNSDGGYVIADGFEYDLFISCGIGGNIQFEDAFLDNYKVKCIAFDGTIHSLPSHRNSIEWVQKNIGYSNTEKNTNLNEYIKDNKKIFLKMDIEGSEFNWLDSLSESELENFSQIVLEVHWPFDMYRMSMLKKLNATHYIIHIHGNNYCDRDIPKHLLSGRTFDGTVTINNQIKLPEVFEVTYVNKKLCDNSLVEMKEIQFPTILDYPNNPNAEDIHFSIPVITTKLDAVATQNNY